MKRVVTALLLAGCTALSACATYDDYGYRDDNDTLRGAATGAAVGAAAGAVGGAVIGGVTPVEGAAAGAVVGGVAGAVAAGTDRDDRGYTTGSGYVDADGDGYDDARYYDRDRDGYYDGQYDPYGRPMPVKGYVPVARSSGERG
jgi:hypothetical protein